MTSSPTERPSPQRAWLTTLVGGLLLGLGSPALTIPLMPMVAVFLLGGSVRGERSDALRGAVWAGLGGAISLRWLPMAFRDYTLDSPWLPYLGAVACQALVGLLAGALLGWLRHRRAPGWTGGLALAAAEGLAAFSPLPLGLVAGLATAAPLLGPLALGGRPLLAFALGAAFLSRRRRPGLIAFVLWLGTAPALWLQHDRGSATVGLVQTGVDGLTARRPSADAERADFLVEHLPRDVDLVLTPEGSWPWEPGRTQRGRSAFRSQWEGLPPTLLGGNADDDGLRNRIALVVDGEVVDHVDKRALVPLAEDRFAAGTGPRLLDVNGLQVAPLICWEDVLPRTVDRLPREADLLALPSSDVWLGPVGQAHHLDAARLATARSGRWSVRATPTGISGVISPRGRLVHTMTANGGDSFTVPLRRPWWPQLPGTPLALLALVAALLWPRR